jgi:hypothetical protein
VFSVNSVVSTKLETGNLKLETFNGEAVVIHSIKSGNWLDSATWDGGNVPNTDNDDIVIAGGHTVDRSIGYLSIGRHLTIESEATLNVNGIFAVSSLDIFGQLNMQNSARIYVFGHTVVHASGLLYMHSSGLYVGNGGQCDVGGWMMVNSNSNANVIASGKVIVYANAWVGVHGNSVYNVDGLTDVLGEFSVDENSLLNVNAGGRMRVYRGLNVSGRIQSRGRIDMMRREARFNDYDENPLIYFDQACGYGQTQIV